ncbi:cadmium resistance transporter [Nostoc sp. FACHB-280]|uniref:cadmium resistance transporter n=1 Tax=Nostoc sp. FACHB-280 TaxID=2692839 RepID=UPI00168C00E0|nr:cadmium resistance transporter [Nostoc sp. FACHB-280]MBD2495862.1 cadmium resistance transporter [Nostoc sp. FACHB-280]
MNEIITSIPTGITAFTATNLDDLVILTLLFSQVNASFRCRHIVIGQYLGFSTLVIASLVGFLGGLILPSAWMGFLGFAPIAIGLNRLLNPDKDSSETTASEAELTKSSPLTNWLSPQAFSVAAITIANGSDNVSIYMPLFANANFSSLLIIITVFLSLVGVWCYGTYKLTRQPAICNLISQYGNNIVPFVLIGLGVFIVLDSASLPPIALAVSCLVLTGLVKLYGINTQVETSSEVDWRI